MAASTMHISQQCLCRVPSRAAFRSGARPAVSRVVLCSARSNAQQSHTSRRAMLAGLIAAPLFASPAFALIPDDDDEDLLVKAKENRSKKLKSELGTEKTFAKSAGFKDSTLAPLQKAVTSLARVGSQLATGDVSGAASTLSGNWVGDAAKEGATLLDFSGVSAAIAAVQQAAGGGDLAQTKTKFVAAVSELQSWASAAGVSAQLRGL